MPDTPTATLRSAAERRRAHAWRVLAWLTAALAVWIVAASGVVAQRARPNVLIVVADDQGWGDLGVTGNPYVATPRIDSLARDGVTLDWFFVQPVCAPTRAELLTGRWHPRGGVRGTGGGQERLDPDERTMADVFRAAGYATGLFGKWHNGGQAPYHPNARGFETFVGYTEGHWPLYVDAPLERNGERFVSRGFLADVVTAEATAFISARRTSPFLAVVALPTPHSPMQVPDAYWDRYSTRPLDVPHRSRADEDIAHTRAALAMTENIDDNVGRLLEALDRSGLAASTVVVYMSDNGPNGSRWNGDMRGRKGSVDEGGVRVPFFLRWPGRVPAGKTVREIAGAIDLLPTLAALADVPVPADRPLDGRSLVPLVRGEAASWPDRELFAFNAAGVSVRTQRHRLDAQGRLYDLDTDPGQREDIAARTPDLAGRLRASARAIADAIVEKTPDTRPIPVGGARRTWLPAGEGRADGSVRRSNRFPNSSFFTEWRPGGTVRWSVEMLQPGPFEVRVFYTAPSSSVGARVRVQLGDAGVTATIGEAHDPPLLGAAHDRVPRQESYTKDFRALSLGRVTPGAGRLDLSLTLDAVPGATGWDVSGVELVRLDAPEHVTVFKAGEHGYHTFRIPAVVRTPKGSLLAFAEGRRQGAADAGDIDLVMRRSDDGGGSWSPLVIVGDDGPDTFGNPCVVVDHATATMWLFVIRTAGADKEQAIIDGRSRSLPRPWVLSSTDDGRTWSAPRDLTASVKRPDWTWYSLGPGIGIQARDGRLVIPGNHALAGSGIHRAHLIYSDDNGATWQIGAVATDGTNESQVVELSDGRLLHNMRNHPPRPEGNFRAIATSLDGGRTRSEVTFDRALVEPPAQASILSVPGDAPGRGWIVFANPASARRERMTVRISDDDARSWRVSTLVYPGPSAYSGLVDLGGDIGLIYERGRSSAYEEIAFVRLPRTWLLAGSGR